MICAGHANLLSFSLHSLCENPVRSMQPILLLYNVEFPLEPARMVPFYLVTRALFFKTTEFAGETIGRGTMYVQFYSDIHFLFRSSNPGFVCLIVMHGLPSASLNNVRHAH